MIKRILPVLLCGCFLPAFSQELALVPGMKITRSVRIRPATYRFSAPADTAKAVIVVEGNDIVIDFAQALLRGSDAGTRPDEYAGVAVVVRNSRKVTIRNLRARGYKVALLASNVQQLVLENCDFSYNYRQHLNSTPEREDLSDWMSYHHNEKDEWLRYGAAIYLRDCYGATVRNCFVTGGQNALMMTRCDHGRIYNNDFSFNSGIGIGMYRCNANEVMYNRLNFNVRGHSEGVYNRGQDSAGILVYEQSSYNLFFKNSATHSGDGFFLWAGQTTMDTGEGGCNFNAVMENDFSYAPTNGVEVTFSRVGVSRNRIFGCDHGIWGGYSYGSQFGGNQFRDNRIAIAIEHGQYNQIVSNTFLRDKEAIRLWSRKEQPADWGYAKYRDTRSVGYTIAYNSFNGNATGVNITGTDSVQIYSNTWSGMGSNLKTDSTVTHLDSAEIMLTDTTGLLPYVKNPADPFKGNGKLAGRKHIRITEWGPYDYRYPLVWLANPAADKMKDTLVFDVLGPSGKWKLGKTKGLQLLSPGQGTLPATIRALPLAGERSDILLELVYEGGSFRTAWGQNVPARKRWPFSYRYYFQPIYWEVMFYDLDTSSFDPVKTGLFFSPLEKKAAFRRESPRELRYAWWGGIREGEANHRQFRTLATGQATLEEGEYELSVTWDDAVRVFIDDKLVLDEWNPSRYTFDESPNRKIRVKLGGNHHFRVEHLELGGFATLGLQVSRLGE